MSNPLPFPQESHFATDFAKGVEPGAAGEPWPVHPRGKNNETHAVDRGVEGGELKPVLYHYLVPDGSDTEFPTPIAGDRIYVGRWLPAETFAGGWGFASGFSGIGALKGQWIDAGGATQTIVFADDSALSASTDFTKFELEAVYERNPSGQVIDLYFELSAPPAAGDVLKGRLDFVV